MTLSVQSTKVRRKRLLKEDNHGSIRKLRRCPINAVRDFPKFCGLGVQGEGGSIDARDGVPQVDSDNDEDVEVDAEYHSPITSMKLSSDSTCRNIGSEVGVQGEGGSTDALDGVPQVDSDNYEDIEIEAEYHSPITSMKPSSDSTCRNIGSEVDDKFEWIEVYNSKVEVGDVPEECQNLTHTSKSKLSNNMGRGKKHQTKVDESEDLNIVPYDAARDISSRNKVQEVRNHYHELCVKLSLEVEESNDGSSKMQVHIKSAMILKKANKWLNREQTVGHVPGVEIGDGFKFRAELVVVGLHREFISGISYATMGDKIYAFSIVDSGRYENKVKSSNVLIYSGQGGNPKVTNSKDQKLQKGNLALKNSMDAKLPIRVIRKVEVEGRKKVYVYDGLYNVMKFSRDRDETGKVGFMFEMVRVEGQPDCDHFNINKQGKSIVETRVVVSEDISEGKEKYPVLVVNEISTEKPARFTYITEMLGMRLQEHPIPSGCGCIGGCSDSHKCKCVRKNGGAIPFNEDGAIVRAKKKIYECGPECDCPLSCQNRSSQHGLKLPLEVFKTRSMGWGVRAREDIPIGSFICEYLGELVGDMEADKRVHDEYLFDLADGTGFTIDAAKFGNVSRFINHACSPNLYAQDVFYDHENKKLPHVMLFASEDIPALTELTYHYNYKIDSVLDANGNIKAKNCCCGTDGCTKRLY